MTISTEPMSLPSQVIDPPPIQFGDLQRLTGSFVSGCDSASFCSVPTLNAALYTLQKPLLGRWNLRQKRFWRPGKDLKIWSVVNFDRAQQREVQSFIRILVANLENLGKHPIEQYRQYRLKELSNE